MCCPYPEIPKYATGLMVLNTSLDSRLLSVRFFAVEHTYGTKAVGYFGFERTLVVVLSYSFLFRSKPTHVTYRSGENTLKLHLS
jgi:hypothetical protein